MNVRVWSHFRGETWEGDVAADALAAVAPVDPPEALFRFFNRVDQRDVDRLAEIGYRLPSLSVDDRIEFDGTVYAVENIGFRRVDRLVPESER